MDETPMSRIIALAREPVASDPAAIDRARGAVRRSSGMRRHPLLAPRVSYAFACALALLAFAAGAWLRGPGRLAVMPAETVAGGQTPVTFVLVAEQAEDVALVGDFNDWTPGVTRLQQRPGGVWSVVVPLRPGRYTYAFLVNGSTWLSDPTAPANAEEDFGRPSSIVLVERGSS